MSGACVIFFISRSTTCLGKYNWLKRYRVEELVCLVRVLSFLSADLLLVWGCTTGLKRYRVEELVCLVRVLSFLSADLPLVWGSTTG